MGKNLLGGGVVRLAAVVVGVILGLGVEVFSVPTQVVFDVGQAGVRDVVVELVGKVLGAGTTAHA